MRRVAKPLFSCIKNARRRTLLTATPTGGWYPLEPIGNMIKRCPWIVVGVIHIILLISHSLCNFDNIK